MKKCVMCMVIVIVKQSGKFVQENLFYRQLIGFYLGFLYFILIHYFGYGSCGFL